MKLRNLNGLIRKSDGPPKMNIVTEDGFVVVSLVKSDLMKGLAAVWPDSTVETGLALNDAGFLVSEAHGDRFSCLPSIASGIRVVDEIDMDIVQSSVRMFDATTLTGVTLNDPDQIDIDELLLGDGPPTFNEDDLDGLLG